MCFFSNNESQTVNRQKFRNKKFMLLLSFKTIPKLKVASDILLFPVMNPLYNQYHDSIQYG